MNGVDLLGIVAVVALTVIGVHFARQFDDDEMEAHYEWEWRNWTAEQEGIPVEWLDDLDELKRLPEHEEPCEASG